MAYTATNTTTTSATLSPSPDTLTTDLSFETNHNSVMMACSNFSQTLFTSLQFYLNKNQACHSLNAQSTLTFRHCHTVNQLTLGKSNLTLQQPLSSTNFQPAYSRICLAARHSYPQQQAKADVEPSIQKYVSLGYPEQALRAKASQMLRRTRWLALVSSLI